MPSVIHVSHEKCRFAFAHATCELGGDSFELRHPWRHARFTFIPVSGTGQMSRCNKDGFPRRLNLKPGPEHAALWLNVADVLGAVLQLLKQGLFPVDVALVGPARKGVLDSSIVTQKPIEKLLRWMLQFLQAK